VKHVQGKNITLNNGVVKKRYFLLHVPNDTVGSVEQNVIKKVNKVNFILKLLYIYRKI
jgi:hypothetical protein